MFEEMAGMVTVNINGLLIQVDLETAQNLNDDPVFRDHYESLVRAQITSEPPVENTGHNTESSTDGYVAKTFLEYDRQEPDDQPEQKTLIWTCKKPTTHDVQATYHFLELRKKMSYEFDDQKNCKNSLWQKIANSLNEKAFYVGKGPEAAEKCRKKFANLQASYMKYKDKRRRTGEGKVHKPPYYDDIEAILGKKDKVNPQIIIDSIKMMQVEETSVCDEVSLPTENLPSTSKICNLPSSASGSTAVASYNKFENIKSSVRPPHKNKIMGDLVTLQKEEMEERRTEFNRMMTFLEKESAQRHEQIMSLLKKSDRGKKRKRESRGESDSDTN